MRFVADFHLHSKYSRATSPKMDLGNLAKWAEIKGIKVLGTGDFTHPTWFQNLKEKLEPAEEGLFKLRKRETRFLLTSELSFVFYKEGRLRKIHLLVFAPSFEVVKKINAQLNWIGNLKSDGRPTFKTDAKELIKIVLNTCEHCLIVPAHVMTPWFAIFGSNSGFDSIEECFGDYSKYIFALETGLSADPKMLWRIPHCRELTLISNSDAHSLKNLAREANVFDTHLSYSGIAEAIRSKDPKKFLYTIEFYPQEGKYHYDGHRNCGVSLSPKETKKYNGICSVCGRPLTIGVLNRVEQLADKVEGFHPKDAIPYRSLVPLREIIAEALQIGAESKRVRRKYKNLIQKFGSELNILLNVPRSELEGVILSEIAEGILRVREGKVHIIPGYDGVYGKIKIFSKEEQKEIHRQRTLF